MNPLITLFLSPFAISPFPQLGMATFNPIPYTYVPTASRLKNTKAPHNRPPKQVSILDKIQHIKVSGTVLGTPAAVAAANGSRNDGPGIRSML